MTKSAITGPIIIYGDRNPPGTGATGSVNADKAPSLVWGGIGLIDPRVGYNVTRFGAIGFSGTDDIVVVDQVPFGLLTNNVATSQTVTSGGTFVLTAGTGVTVVTSQPIVWASGNTIPVNALVLDGLPALVPFGLASVATGNTTISIYDPTKAIARNLVLTSNSGGDSGTVTFLGADLYGYPMTQTVTISAGSTVATTKAFKFVYSATLSVGGALAAGALIGTGDVYGFPVLASSYGYLTVFWNNTYAAASTGFVAPVLTAATAITGDVRGTYALQGAASNSTLRLTISVSPSVANLGTISGLFGVTQF